MYTLLLTVYLQACLTCEVNHEVVNYGNIKDEFSCSVALRHMINHYKMNEFDIRQYATGSCEVTK